MHVFVQGRFSPLVTMDDIAGLTAAEESTMFLMPKRGALVLVGRNQDELIVHPFDLDDLLGKSGLDYLVVASEPPTDLFTGDAFEYSPSVRSKKGGVKIRLDSGPEGMKVSPEGKVTWTVPAGAAKQEVVVILTISDASGQEIFHTFRVNITDRSAPMAPATGPPQAPAPREMKK
jgi:hypothetical protein